MDNIITVVSLIGNGVLLISGFVIIIIQFRNLKKERKRIAYEETRIAIRLKGWRDDTQVISNNISVMKDDIKNNPEMLAKEIKSGLENIGQLANSVYVNIIKELKELKNKANKKNAKSENQ